MRGYKPTESLIEALQVCSFDNKTTEEIRHLYLYALKTAQSDIKIMFEVLADKQYGLTRYAKLLFNLNKVPNIENYGVFIHRLRDKIGTGVIQHGFHAPKKTDSEQPQTPQKLLAFR